MKPFLDKDFLLQNESAKKLYHEFAENLPLIDYHNHLPVAQIADDINFENVTQVWLYGDHYKWRAMRANGVDESYCTGDKTDWEKFEKWAATVPYMLRNPLYHWTHLELQRYFDIYDLLNEESARKIYEECNQKLRTKEYSVRNLLRKMNVQVLCTTDDPVDSLAHHQKIKDDGFEIKVYPAFRPDKATGVEDPSAFRSYVKKLEEASGIAIDSYQNFVSGLKQRHDFFASMGCFLSDHGIEYLPAKDYTHQEVAMIFEKVINGESITAHQVSQFKSALLYQFALWDHEKGWVQQYHFGALRNNNSRILSEAGADAGCDSIGDFSQAASLGKFLDRLDQTNQLAKTILYNVNPSDNEVTATMAGNFNDGSIAGKIQFGAAWWFMDQKDGITRQLDALSNMGTLSKMAGMLTDSRSFLSFPRHEYFRRILCNLFGTDIENGELPNDLQWTGKIVQDICYYNALQYFNVAPVSATPANAGSQP